MLRRCLLSVVVAASASSVVPAAAVDAQPGITDDSRSTSNEDFALTNSEIVFQASSDGSVQARRTAPATLTLSDEPEMLIIDTHGAVAALSVRSRNDGVWSEWIDVETPLDEAPDGLRGNEGSGRVSAIGPIWIGDGAQEIEITLLDGAVDRVSVETLRSIVDDEPDLVPAAASRDGGATALSTFAPRPAIQPRSSWATRGWRSENEGCDGGPFLANNVRTVVVHHTVTSNSYAASQVDDMLRGIYRLHVDINGWCDIAYNFVVDRFGTIWEARSGGVDLPVIGGHAKGFNTWTVGVAVLGNHHTAGSPTAGAVASVEALAAWKLSLHGVDPLGVNWLQNRSSRPPHKYPERSWVEMPAIVGHRDLGFTSCPGSLLYPSIGPMRQALVPAHLADAPHVPPGRNPAEFGPALLTVESTGGLRSAGSAWSRGVDPLADGRSAIAVGGRDNRGQILDSSGRLTAFGGAPVISGQPAGTRTPVDLAMAADAGQGWVLTDTGRIDRFGGAPDRTAASRPPDGRAVAFALDESGRGYVLGATGSLHPVNGAADRTLGTPVDAIDIALFANSDSGWVLDRSGRMHPFGDAPAWQPERSISAPRAIVAQGDYGGWVLDSEGRLIRFGDERRIQPISTTVSSPSAVDVAIVDWDTSLDSEDMRYAAALRTLFLGRAGDGRDIDLAAHRAVEFGAPTVVSELASSEAWAANVLGDMYRDVLGREPDSQGLRFWIDRLNDGMLTQQIGTQFYSSPEYIDAAGTTDAWLGRLYRALLERKPDAGGLQYWRGRLAAGTSPYEVTASFYFSPESRNGRVIALYQQILGRDPEPGGQAFWADQLNAIDDIRLAVELATSGEYYDLVTN